MSSRHETTTGQIFSKKLRKLIQYNLKWNLLRCVTVNGGKNKRGAEKALV